MTTTSYQIPDILSSIECRKFALRTNNGCKAVMDASLAWFQSFSSTSGSNNAISEEELAFVKSAKFGLLAALCFPTCDMPQLRLVTDFWTCFCISSRRALHTLDPGPYFSFEELDDVLTGHPLFKWLQPRLDDLISTASESWRERFLGALRAVRSAQFTVAENRRAGRIPTSEEYIEIRKDLSGVRLLICFIDLVEGLVIPQGDPDEEASLEKLRETTVKILALSWDIFYYNHDQSIGNTHNLVSVIMHERGVTLQGAMNAAAALVKSAFSEFAEAERSIMSLHPPPILAETTSSQQTSGWWNPFTFLGTGGASSSPRGAWDQAVFHDVRLYIQGLKDCIVGALNWSYGTELFFGDKGEEVRAFGWVFLMA